MAAEPQQESAPVVPVPQSLDQVDALLQRLGTVTRAITERRQRGEAHVSRINQATAEAVRPLEAEQEALAAAIQGYALANRDELTRGGAQQTVELNHGVLSWHRDGRGTLEVDDEAQAIARLKKRRGGRAFIRISESLKKEELKKVPQMLAAIGARVVYRESLTIQLKPTPMQRKRGVSPLKLVRRLN